MLDVTLPVNKGFSKTLTKGFAEDATFPVCPVMEVSPKTAQDVKMTIQTNICY